MIRKKQELEKQEEPVVEKKKTKRRAKKKDSFSRKPIIILFLATVVIPLLFLGFASFKKTWQNFDNSEVEVEPLSQIKDRQEATAAVSKIIEPLEGEYGFYVYSFADNSSYGLNFHKTFKTKLSLKLPLMASFFLKSQEQALDPSTVYVLSDKDKKEEGGVLWAKPEGERLTYLELLKMLGQYSDNTALHVLQKRIGSQAINETISKLALKQTDAITFETTPRDLGLFFKQIYATDLLEEKNKRTLFDFLSNSAFEKRIPRLLPKEVVVYHLESTESDSFADAGVVLAERPFVLVIVSNNTKEKEARNVFPEIAKTIFDFETGK